MNVLIACEESQTVCKAFREIGHNAFSCDIQECSGGHPEWHILGDVMRYLNPTKYENCIAFSTMDGEQHLVEKWNLIIAHPPCTFLSNVATRHHSLNASTLERINERTFKRIEAMQFFMNIANADCDKIAIENPVGYMNTLWRKPDQIIQPYMFGDPFEKKTCLWLKNLPKLVPTDEVRPPERVKYDSGKTMPAWYAEAWRLSPEKRAKERSKTFPGIARAMASQWSGILTKSP